MTTSALTEGDTETGEGGSRGGNPGLSDMQGPAPPTVPLPPSAL